MGMVNKEFEDKLKDLLKVYGNRPLYCILRITKDKNGRIRKKIVRSDLCELHESLEEENDEEFKTREEFEKRNYIG